jgi:hypothetical protein
MKCGAVIWNKGNLLVQRGIVVQPPGSSLPPSSTDHGMARSALCLFRALHLIPCPTNCMPGHARALGGGRCRPSCMSVNDQDAGVDHGGSGKPHVGNAQADIAA